jgi:hypothetical protein
MSLVSSEQRGSGEKQTTMNAIQFELQMRTEFLQNALRRLEYARNNETSAAVTKWSCRVQSALADFQRVQRSLTAAVLGGQVSL